MLIQLLKKKISFNLKIYLFLFKSKAILTINLEKSTETYLDFWQELVENNPDIDKL